MRVAIYARVSTKDQKTDMQLTELREYVKRAGWEASEYLETASSVKRRPVFDCMLADARSRKFELILVWKIDRFARSMKQFVDVCLALSAHGVGVQAVTQNISTNRTDPMSQFVVGLFALLAELERNIIVERTKAGVAEARRQGKHCGRPPKVYQRDRARELRDGGMSWRAIARELGIPQSTVRKHLQGCA